MTYGVYAIIQVYFYRKEYLDRYFSGQSTQGYLPGAYIGLNTEEEMSQFAWNSSSYPSAYKTLLSEGAWSTSQDIAATVDRSHALGIIYKCVLAGNTGAPQPYVTNSPSYTFNFQGDVYVACYSSSTVNPIRIRYVYAVKKTSGTRVSWRYLLGQPYSTVFMAYQPYAFRRWPPRYYGDNRISLYDIEGNKLPDETIVGNTIYLPNNGWHFFCVELSVLGGETSASVNQHLAAQLNDIMPITSFSQGTELGIELARGWRLTGAEPGGHINGDANNQYKVTYSWKKTLCYPIDETYAGTQMSLKIDEQLGNYNPYSHIDTYQIVAPALSGPVLQSHLMYDTFTFKREKVDMAIPVYNTTDDDTWRLSQIKYIVTKMYRYSTTTEEWLDITSYAPSGGAATVFYPGARPLLTPGETVYVVDTLGANTGGVNSFLFPGYSALSAVVALVDIEITSINSAAQSYSSTVYGRTIKYGMEDVIEDVNMSAKSSVENTWVRTEIEFFVQHPLLAGVTETARRNHIGVGKIWFENEANTIVAMDGHSENSIYYPSLSNGDITITSREAPGDINSQGLDVTINAPSTGMPPSINATGDLTAWLAESYSLARRTGFYPYQYYKELVIEDYEMTLGTGIILLLSPRSVHFDSSIEQTIGMDL